MPFNGGSILVREQDPLPPGNMALPPGWSFGDFIELLNSLVFLWPDTSSGPVPYGIRHFERYQCEDPVILRVPTRDAVDQNVDPGPQVCRFNSGSPRCSQGRPSPRGPETFQPLASADFTAGRVVEVVFQEAFNLPSTT
ncbi:MAG: hypothetical protein WD534_17910, partial [Phycisphaeraceae bacterium]